MDLDKDKMSKRKKGKKIAGICFVLIALLFFPWLAALIDRFLSRQLTTQGMVSWLESFKLLFSNLNVGKLWFFLCVGWAMYYFYVFNRMEAKLNESDTFKVTENIELPKAVGEGQHGTARFMKEEEKDKTFDMVVYDGKSHKSFEGKKGGLVIETTMNNGKEYIRYVSGPIHSIILASTRSGKTRRVILESVWLTLMAGQSIVVSDPKGEIYYYTSPLAKELGYEVYTLDLREPSKSMHYNYMQDVLDALYEGDIPKAIDRTWDIVSVLVGEPKGEPLWANGESATIAAGILILAIDAPEEFRNLENVYYFLAYMCETIIDENGEEAMPINRYLDNLPEDHPAKIVFAMAKVAASRTRSSFFTSALGTLRNFINWRIGEMTSHSDYKLSDVANKKSIVYMIIPDEKITLYPLVSIYVNQMYVSMVEQANIQGGKLAREIHFFLDEMGNFPTIPGLGAMLSAGAGRGIHLHLVLQDYQQLEKKYKDDFENVKANTLLTVYLRSTSPKTNEELSKRLGKYTVQTATASSSINSEKTNNISYSSSSQMAGRELLTADELARFDTPQGLVIYGGNFPAIVNLPDLSKYYANAEMGLGDEEYNRKVIMERSKEREERSVGKPNVWGIWTKYKNEMYYELQKAMEEEENEDEEDDE